MATKKKAAKRKAAKKRELVKPAGDARYIRRDERGEFKKVVEVGRSLAADRRSKAGTVAKAIRETKGSDSR